MLVILKGGEAEDASQKEKKMIPGQYCNPDKFSHMLS